MKTFKTFFATLCILLSSFAFAISLGDAKQQGLIGEMDNGYLGVVTSSAEVEKLVASVNTKRKAAYLELAKKNGITLEQVQKLAAQKTYNKTEPGHYIWKNGSWVKK